MQRLLPEPQPLSVSRQVAAHQLLVSARKTWLVDALQAALGSIDPQLLRTQIGQYVPPDVQQALAAAGIRDEYVFPTPVVLEAQPTLVAYYRLLMGVSQKMFYRTGTGMGQFKSMETGRLTANQRKALPAFCRAMNASLADLVRQLSPSITQRDVSELPLLTLGSQFQGANNVTIGQQAILGVFLTLREVLDPHVTQSSDRALTLVNSAGRAVRLTLRSDPDISIEEQAGTAWRKRVAIEIKGGTDVSNAHNRAGEAEKSHQKAKAEGFRECWTVIITKGLSLEKLAAESPTTDIWFDTSQILARQGKDWEEFRSRLIEVVGVPL